MTRTVLSSLAVASAMALVVLLAFHFRYATVAGVGAHFYLVDRWTGKTWLVRGTLKSEVESAQPIPQPVAPAAAPPSAPPAAPPLANNAQALAKLGNLDLLELEARIQIELEARNIRGPAKQ